MDMKPGFISECEQLFAHEMFLKLFTGDAETKTLRGKKGTHPLRHHLLKLVIEQTFVNSSLSGQNLRRQTQRKHVIRMKTVSLMHQIVEFKSSQTQSDFKLHHYFTNLYFSSHFLSLLPFSFLFHQLVAALHRLILKRFQFSVQQRVTTSGRETHIPNKSCPDLKPES